MKLIVSVFALILLGLLAGRASAQCYGGAGVYHRAAFAFRAPVYATYTQIEVPRVETYAVPLPPAYGYGGGFLADTGVYYDQFAFRGVGRGYGYGGGFAGRGQFTGPPIRRDVPVAPVGNVQQGALNLNVGGGNVQKGVVNLNLFGGRR